MSFEETLEKHYKFEYPSLNCEGKIRNFHRMYDVDIDTTSNHYYDRECDCECGYNCECDELSEYELCERQQLIEEYILDTHNQISGQSQDNSRSDDQSDYLKDCPMNCPSEYRWLRCLQKHLNKNYDKRRRKKEELRACPFF